MLKIYKKVEKTKDFPMGYVEIDPASIDRPFLMCISAQDNFDKSIYGTIREGARAARLYTSQEDAAGYKTNEFPAYFLGFRFIRDNNYESNYEEFVDTFLYPFLIGNGARSMSEIKKKARMINFMTYCNGTMTYKRIEKYLEKKLVESGFLLVDIDSILNQLSCVSIGTTENTSNIKATSACFIDLNDDEIHNDRTDHYSNVLSQNQRDSIFGLLGDNQNILYFYNGSGNHSLKEYLSDRALVKPALCSVISFLLSNSISNSNSNDFTPISNSDISSVLGSYTNGNENISELLTKIDNNINYSNAPKYSDGELLLRKELDELYRDYLKTKYRAERKENELNEIKEKVNAIVDQYIDDYSVMRILDEVGLYQIPKSRIKIDNSFQKNDEKSLK